MPGKKISPAPESIRKKLCFRRFSLLGSAVPISSIRLLNIEMKTGFARILPHSLPFLFFSVSLSLVNHKPTGIYRIK